MIFMMNVKVVSSCNIAEFERDVDYYMGEGYHVAKYATESVRVTIVSNGGYHSEDVEKIQHIAFMEANGI